MTKHILERIRQSGSYKLIQCIILLLFVGTALLVLVSAEVDTTGSSYYGEQSLHFVSVRGDSSLVPLGELTFDEFITA